MIAFVLAKANTNKKTTKLRILRVLRTRRQNSYGSKDVLKSKAKAFYFCCYYPIF